jgi:protein-disulfide isomerase
MPGCRPSKAELAAISTQLQQIRVQQQELDARMQQLEEREANAVAGTQVELDSLVAGINGMVARLAALEERAAKANRPVADRPDLAAVYRVTLGDSHTKGPSDALVTIVMWTDYQCPYSAKVQATLDQLARDYGRELRFVQKHNPLGFHPRAMPAALAAEAAGRQGKFWEMHALVFENQKDLTDENFRKWAKQLKLKERRFAADLDDPELRKRIEAQQAQGVTLGARGTPAFFINGRFMSGAQLLERFKALIDEERAKAQELVNRGVRREEVYEVTIAEGRTKV